MTEKKTHTIRTRLICIGILILSLVVLNALCTQYIAYKLAYARYLGNPLYGDFYKPYIWLSWMFRHYDKAPSLFIGTFIYFSFGFLFCLLTYVLLMGFSTRSSRKNFGIHGTAHFADQSDIEDCGLLPKKGEAGAGVYCGGFKDHHGYLHYLRHNGPEHVIGIAPTRAGKGVGLVIPTLLSWPHSVFVLDRKGENYAITAGWRKNVAKNVVLRFDPAEPIGGCSWNALAEVRFGTEYQVGDAQNIALLVVDSDGRGVEGDHFRSAAYELLVGLILHALYKGKVIGKLPGLSDCAYMLSGVGDFSASGPQQDTANDEGDPRALSALFAEMTSLKIDDDGAAGRAAQLVINGIGRRMGNTPTRELGSIISTANNALSIYRDPIVAANTTRVDFKVSDMMDSDTPVSLYFTSTPRNADRLRPLARLLISLMTLTLADKMEYDTSGRSKTNHKNRLLLMLDEFPTLGRMDAFEKSLAYLAGYGIKAYLIIQDITQLYKEYTKNENIIANCHTRVVFAPNNKDTAEWISAMAGKTTAVSEQLSTSGKRFGMMLENVHRSYQQSERALLTVQEVMDLPGPKHDAEDKLIEGGQMLIFVAGHPVIKGQQILYFKDALFSERSKIPPPQASDILRKAPEKKAEPKQKKPEHRSFVIQ